MKKTWGLDPLSFPVLAFNSESERQKFIKAYSQESDWVLIVATMTKNSNPEEKGRILGRVRVSSGLYDVPSLLKDIGTELKKEWFDDWGNFKWPYGLPITHAELYVDRPKLKEIFGTNLSGYDFVRTATSIHGCVSQEQLEILDAQKTTQIEFDDVEAIRKIMYLDAKLGKYTGPLPGGDRKSTTVSFDKAYTYLFEMIGSRRGSVFKVGFTTNPELRLKTLNKGLVREATGCYWKVADMIMFGDYEDPYCAFVHEQLLHESLKGKSLASHREIYKIDSGKIWHIWGNARSAAKWLDPVANEKYRPSFKNPKEFESNSLA